MCGLGDQAEDHGEVCKMVSGSLVGVGVEFSTELADTGENVGLGRLCI